MNYESLIERDLGAISDVAYAYAESDGPEALWLAVTRFAVLAYAPSQHAKRAVLACQAAHVVRDEVGDSWVELLVACARYASESRQPWSEPPVLEPPEPSSADLREIREAMLTGDRLRAERWLSASLSSRATILLDIVRGDARLLLDAATMLLPLLGEKGDFALLRMPVLELIANPEASDPSEPVDALVRNVAAQRGSVEAVGDLLVAVAACGTEVSASGVSSFPTLVPYNLARDYAQTLIAHAFARRLPAAQAHVLLDAVHHNLEHGESYAEWSFA